MIKDWLLVWLGVIAIAFLAVRGLRSLRRNAPPPNPAAPAPPRPAAATPASPAQTAGAPPAEAKPSSPLVLADKFREFYEACAHPEDLLGNSDFEAGVVRLCDPSIPLDQVVNYCMGANAQLAALGAEALARRADSAPAIARVVDHLRYANVWTVFFILRFLDARADRPAIGLVLAQSAGIGGHAIRCMPQIVGDFVDAHAAPRASSPQLREALEASCRNWTPTPSMPLLDALITPQAGRLREAFWRVAPDARRRDLPAVGRQDLGRPARCQRRRRAPAAVRGREARVCNAWSTTPPQSFLITGESGTGKTALFRLLAARADGSEAGPSSRPRRPTCLSGQVYIGEIERRVKQMQDNLDAARRVLWYVPNFHELYYAGRHRFSPHGLLDLFLPAVEAGRICMVGEVQPAALQKLLQERPRVRLAFKEMRLEPLAAAETLELARAPGRARVRARARFGRARRAARSARSGAALSEQPARSPAT